MERAIGVKKKTKGQYGLPNVPYNDASDNSGPKAVVGFTRADGRVNSATAIGNTAGTQYANVSTNSSLQTVVALSAAAPDDGKGLSTADLVRKCKSCSAELKGSARYCDDTCREKSKLTCEHCAKRYMQTQPGVWNSRFCSKACVAAAAQWAIIPPQGGVVAPAPPPPSPENSIVRAPSAVCGTNSPLVLDPKVAQIFNPTVRPDDKKSEPLVSKK